MSANKGEYKEKRGGKRQGRTSWKRCRLSQRDDIDLHAFPRRCSAQIYANGSRCCYLFHPPDSSTVRSRYLAETTRADDEVRFV